MGPTPTNYLAGDPPELLAQVHGIRNALGTHTTSSRVQGSKLKTKREIRIATMFREVPEAFLRMILVHELAHLKESAHGKAFYALCLGRLDGEYAGTAGDIYHLK